MPHFTKYNADPCSSPDITTRSYDLQGLNKKTGRVIESYDSKMCPNRTPIQLLQKRNLEVS
jgi:hypothetical protein